MNIWQPRSSVPPKNRLLIAYCPDWSDLGYQICEYRNGKYYYPEQPNDMFDENVEKWSLLLGVK